MNFIFKTSSLTQYKSKTTVSNYYSNKLTKRTVFPSFSCLRLNETLQLILKRHKSKQNSEDLNVDHMLEQLRKARNKQYEKTAPTKKNTKSLFSYTTNPISDDLTQTSTLTNKDQTHICKPTCQTYGRFNGWNTSFTANLSCTAGAMEFQSSSHCL